MAGAGAVPRPCRARGQRPGGRARGPFTATVPPLYFSAQTDPASVLARGGANWVKGGATWFISGEVKNESAYKDLCVAPLMPSFTGNAAGVGPHDITVAGNTQLAPPYAGELRPGQSVDLSMFVNTSADGSTRGSVDLNPQAGVLAPGGQCTAATIGAMTMLAAGDTTMAKGSTDQVVHVDTSVPVAPPSSLPVNAVYFYGAYASHFWSNVAGKLFSLVASARDAVSFQNFYDNLLLHSPPVARGADRPRGVPGLGGGHRRTGQLLAHGVARRTNQRAHPGSERAAARRGRLLEGHQRDSRGRR